MRAFIEGVPIAMPTVLSVVLALGASALARRGAVVGCLLMNTNTHSDAASDSEA